MFIDGPFAGRVAIVGFPCFKVGMVVNADGHDYRVRRGPIAELIERDGKACDHGVINLEYVVDIEV
jgi:hypothetical protein